MLRAKIEQHIIRARTKQGRNVHAFKFSFVAPLSFSSLLANAGVAEETRMALTGHTTARSINTTHTTIWSVCVTP